MSVRAGTVKRVRVVHATGTGRISTSFAALPAPIGCHGLPLVATARTAGTTAVVLRISSPGSSRDCAPKQPVNS